MTHDELTQLLINAGFDTGWALCDTELVFWEHEQDPPQPLVRPTKSNNE